MMVSHPSTNQVSCCLGSQIRGNPVCSGWYVDFCTSFGLIAELSPRAIASFFSSRCEHQPLSFLWPFPQGTPLEHELNGFAEPHVRCCTSHIPPQHPRCLLSLLHGVQWKAFRSGNHLEESQAPFGEFLNLGSV